MRSLYALLFGISYNVLSERCGCKIGVLWYSCRQI